MHITYYSKKYVKKTIKNIYSINVLLETILSMIHDSNQIKPMIDCNQTSSCPFRVCVFKEKVVLALQMRNKYSGLE